MDTERLKNSIKLLNKKFNGNIVPFGKSLNNINVNFIPTNNKKLDDILCGGLPEGRLVELHGHESTGKTTLAYYLCSQFEYSAFIDAEGTFDEERAKLFNNRPGHLIINRPDNGEEAIETIIEFINAGVPFIVIDSIPALYPIKQQEKDVGKEEFSPVARLMSQQFLPKVEPALKKNKSIVFCINRLRDNIVSFGHAEPFITLGGKALRYAFSVRIELARKGWLGATKDTRYGLLQSYRVVKSKVATPYKVCEFPFIWDHGYCETVEEAKDIRKSLLVEKRNKTKKKKKERNI